MKRTRWNSAWLLATIVAIGCGGGKPQDVAATRQPEAPVEPPIQLAEAPAGAPATAGGSATISGTVRFEGTAPTPKKVNMGADPKCAEMHKEPLSAVIAKEPGAPLEEYYYITVNSNGTLKDVFIYVKQGLEGKAAPPPMASVKLDQAGCRYQPHVFGIQVNQPLEIVNSDATDHNINAISTAAKRTLFNVSQGIAGPKQLTKKFTKAEVMVKIKCNVHPWMRAYAGVLDHPFYGVSGEDGAFAITGLPAGTYTLEAWHEKYGTQTQQVTVADGETKSVDFTFKIQ